MIRGVFFDLGGTLFSYRHLPRTTMQLLQATCERLGITADREAVRHQYQQATADMTLVYADKTYYLHRDFFCDTLRRFLELLDVRASHDDIAWYEETHRLAVVDCLELKADCRETLESLRARELYLSIVSNIDEDMLTPLVERESLGRYLDHWTSSETARSCKPNPVFFAHALSLSGLAPHEVLFVGDSPEHDIVGASAAGMRTVLISDGGLPPPLQSGKNTVKPDHIIGSLSELQELIVD